MPKLALVPTYSDVAPFAPAAMYEVAAAKYVKMDIGSFRQLVKAGTIPARSHPGRTRYIFFREDLDSYLRNLPVVDPKKRKMPNGEVSTKPPHIKEVSSGS